jgi:hypothetical protein
MMQQARDLDMSGLGPFISPGDRTWRNATMPPAVVPQQVSVAECLVVVAMLGVLLVFNVLTGAWFPIPWLDEVMFTDPAKKLLLGKGFTSTAWFGQGAGEFWAGYPPLYQIVLYHWTKAVGFGMVEVRSLNYVLITASAFMLWLSTARLGLILRRNWRVFFVAFVCLSYGVTFAYRSGRMDCLGIAILSAMLLSLSLRSEWARHVLLFGLAVLLPLTGLQLVVYVGLLGAIVFAMAPRALLSELVCVAIGTMAGLGIMYAVYTLTGVWDNFVASTAGKRTLLGDGLASRLAQYGHTLSGVMKDASFLIVLLLAGGMLARELVGGRFAVRSALGFGLIVALVVPGALFVIGVYPIYYSWMAFIPLSIALFHMLESQTLAGGWHRLTTRVLLVAGMVAGLPLISAWSAVYADSRDPAAVASFIESHVQPTDIALSDYAAFYAIAPVATEVYFPAYLDVMSEQEKRAISILVVAPAEFPSLARQLGGEWTFTGAELRSRHNDRWTSVSIWGPQYDLAVYRRATAN